MTANMVFFACNGRFYTGSNTHQIVYGMVDVVLKTRSAGWTSEKTFTAPDNLYTGITGIDIKTLLISATNEIFITSGKNAKPYVMLIKTSDGSLS
jgi:hypothetical protein